LLIRGVYDQSHGIYPYWEPRNKLGGHIWAYSTHAWGVKDKTDGINPGSNGRVNIFRGL
jgi:hypothetical protein